ncbi:hypothetical protein E2C01_086916 [Portunus trituberculatus]|uniref:Uncharacterized protein n=1 Tax=Portunus trituberculatus TaxID=210409 RepID=A0A5B7JB14_PORTR|nr:hypothetical protein [Portunus trituberculatus]
MAESSDHRGNHCDPRSVAGKQPTLAGDLPVFQPALHRQPPFLPRH